MAATLTIAVLVALSFVIVRIAAVAMRHTGLTENVARFQCISALTGTGFTTSESEMIVNYPVRRRILVALMLLGNLGLVSVAATFIISFMDTEPLPGAMARQAIMIASAIGITLLVLTNKALDRAMCNVIGALLLKTTSLGKRHYQSLLQLDNGYSVAEHIYRGINPVTVKELLPSSHQLALLAIRGKSEHRNEQIAGNVTVSPGEILVIYGKDEEHEKLADALLKPGASQDSGDKDSDIRS